MTPETIGKLAREALEKEVLLTPKPGLVDAANCGAHKDMDKQAFLRSAAALEPWFRRMAERGKAFPSESPKDLLAALRPVGMEAEKDMYAATKGVNTHKGALFSLGLLCAACGRLQAQNQPLTAQTLCGLAAEMTAGITDREMQAADTHGLKVHAVYGAKGVRGEAESGFESVRDLALPLLKEEQGPYKALLNLISHVRDTNVLHRAGEEGLAWLQSRAGETLSAFSIPALESLDRECIAKNISPGGSADLLAIAFFLDAVCQQKNVGDGFPAPAQFQNIIFK